MNDTRYIATNLRQPQGVGPFLRPAADLPNKPEVNTNSWFVIGHVEADGHTLNFLYHVFTAPAADGTSAVVSALAFTNETTGAHVSGVAVHPAEKAAIVADPFSVTVPDGFLSGDLDQLRVKASIPEGSVDVVMKPVGHVLYNGGTGFFPMLGLDVHQYYAADDGDQWNAHDRGTHVRDQRHVLVRPAAAGPRHKPRRGQSSR
jgi:hypothetical protein